MAGSERRGGQEHQEALFIGEFGVPRIGTEVEKQFCCMLRIIEESDVLLAALWVFDLPSQNSDHNITADNERFYQLREVAEANARVQKGGTAR